MILLIVFGIVLILLIRAIVIPQNSWNYILILILIWSVYVINFKIFPGALNL
ncbi:hypothetical protein CPAV1605_1095 [seawater metagenome]|uniref:Uncharacterized protein n=1 Tax=seawater metagenome TaxID=1561972 RepID=A0A5E8CKT0_9ZZZZ